MLDVIVFGVNLFLYSISSLVITFFFFWPSLHRILSTSVKKLKLDWFVISSITETPKLVASPKIYDQSLN